MAQRVLTVAGAVAVGKSTIAAALADELRVLGRRVAVVSTDGFLHPNAVLEAQGLLHRKGFPETYDLDHLDRFVAAARTGQSPLDVPVYSHERYDVVDEPLRIDGPDGFARDVALDPGRATAPRIAVPHMLPSSE